MYKNCYIIQTNCVTPLGFDVESNFEAILNGTSGIQLHESSPFMSNSFYAATIDNKKLDTAFSQIESNSNFSRLEKMMILALQPIVSKQKITPKSAFILSTTKGNITALATTENAIEAAHLSALAKKIAVYFGFTTEPIVVSNACVSGVLAVAVAKRMIQAGVYDDAFLVAGDEVSEFVLSGFNSFQAMSESPCKPYDKDRNGVTLGEATAAVYITSDESKIEKGVIKILGDGSVNDANHISGPSRTGEGLYRSIASALKEANVASNQIDYLSAHGTATLYNDEMEAIAFNRLDLQNVPVNSYKGFFGHTLGASGLLETVISVECTNRNQLIASKEYSENGVSQSINIIDKNAEKEITYFLKTASGFGGCNTAVIFEKIK
jgi:3-oxoacyl-[acyl-carrier-protein] synthase I